MKKLFLTLGVVSLLVASCNNKNQNEIKEISEAKEVVEASKDANSYSINLNNSNIKWKGETLVSNHFGTIKFKEGKFFIKEGKLESGNFVADLSTLKSEDIEDAETAAKLDGHLKSADFFDIEKNPTSTFNITSIKSLEGDYNTELEGNLIVKGASGNLSIKANVKVEGNKVRIKTEKFTFNRQKFAITYSNDAPTKDKVIKDNIELEISIEADKESAK